jgi:hypothetical protein
MVGTTEQDRRSSSAACRADNGRVELHSKKSLRMHFEPPPIADRNPSVVGRSTEAFEYGSEHKKFSPDAAACIGVDLVVFDEGVGSIADPSDSSGMRRTLLLTRHTRDSNMRRPFQCLASSEADT